MARNLIYSHTIADFRGIIASPGAILLDGHEIIAAGSPQEIGSIPDANIQRIEGLVIPPFANIHTHLDLSGVGIKPPAQSFVTWVEETVTPIRTESSVQEVQTATKLGIDLALAGGTAMVGDIASTEDVADQVEKSILGGVSFVEVFGLGDRQALAIEKINVLSNRFGISPHAPYSCGLDVYRAAFESGRPVATHLAEMQEELEATKNGSGDLVEFATRLGVRNDTATSWNKHPIDGLMEILGERSMIAVHVNYMEDRHVELLANSQVTVAYCPRASAYFGHTNHRYREMLASGIAVALGTDSLICLDTPDRISLLDELRYLFKEGCTDPSTLLTMATVNGARALGEDTTLLTLEVGRIAGLLAIESASENAFESAMVSTTPPRWIVPLTP